MGRRHQLFLRLVRAMGRLSGARRVEVSDAWFLWSRRHDWRTY